MDFRQCTVKQMKEAIKDLDDSSIIITNLVSNLNVYRVENEFLVWTHIIELGNERLDVLKADLEKVQE